MESWFECQLSDHMCAIALPAGQASAAVNVWVYTSEVQAQGT